MRAPKMQTLAGLAAVLLIVGACGGDDDAASPTEGEDGNGGGDGVTLQVATADNSFEPSSLSAPAGSDVTVEVSNEGDNPHTFTIDDLEVDTSTIDSGESATVTFTMPETSVTFYCEIHGEDAMSGTIETS